MGDNSRMIIVVRKNLRKGLYTEQGTVIRPMNGEVANTWLMWFTCARSLYIEFSVLFPYFARGYGALWNSAKDFYSFQQQFQTQHYLCPRSIHAFTAYFLMGKALSLCFCFSVLSDLSCFVKARRRALVFFGLKSRGLYFLPCSKTTFYHSPVFRFEATVFLVKSRSETSFLRRYSTFYFTALLLTWSYCLSSKKFST